MLNKHIEIDNLNSSDLIFGQTNAGDNWSDFPACDRKEIGHVVISDLKTNQVLEKTNNLVLLSGREVLLQKIIGIGSDLNYNIRYFQVGDGGCTVGTTPSKIGPYDDDTGLKNSINFSDNNNLDNGIYKYIHNGKSKLIKADEGNIEIIDEVHEINTIDSTGNQIMKQMVAKTTVKFTMYVLPEECYSKDADGNDYPSRVFRFNEAALLYVEMDGTDNDIPAGADDNIKFNAPSKIFARFTSLNKYLEAQDGIKIEWFILV